MGASMRRRAGNALFCLILLGLTLGALGHVAVQAKKVEVALLLGKERAQHEELLAEQRHLQLEIGKLKDPRRLVAVARKTLGMTPQAAIQVLHPATSVGVSLERARTAAPRLPAAAVREVRP